EDAVHSLDLLFLAKLQAVSDNLGLAIAPVLTGREVTFLDGARGLEAALPFKEQLHGFPAAQTANRSCISSQFSLLIAFSDASFLRGPASVVGNRRGIPDR